MQLGEPLEGQTQVGVEEHHGRDHHRGEEGQRALGEAGGEVLSCRGVRPSSCNVGGQEHVVNEHSVTTIGLISPDFV